RKPATDRLDKGGAVEPRLAQARTGGEIAARAPLPPGAGALQASGLVPRPPSRHEARRGLRPRGCRTNQAKPQNHEGTPEFRQLIDWTGFHAIDPASSRP